MPNQNLSRRGLLAGVGGIAALAGTGWTRGSTRSLSETRRPLADGPPRGLIIFGSNGGDPAANNTPGTYDNDDRTHPQQAGFEKADVVLGGTAYAGAQAWADVPQALRDKLAFLHFSPGPGGHGSWPAVMRLKGATEQSEQIVSYIAEQNQAALGTILDKPLHLGHRLGPGPVAKGNPIPYTRTTSLASHILGYDHPVRALDAARDRVLDEMWEIYKEGRNPLQLEMVEKFETSRDQLRSVSPELLGLLDAAPSDDTDGQVVSAPVALALGLTSVVSCYANWGGDNHIDAGLEGEAGATRNAIAQLTTLHDNIVSLQEQGHLGEVVVAVITEFGRTFESTEGRAHNQAFNTAILLGDGVRPGVIGGLKPDVDRGAASNFDPDSGEILAEGGVSPEDSLPSVGKTLGALCGVDEERTEVFVRAGVKVGAALA